MNLECRHNHETLFFFSEGWALSNRSNPNQDFQCLGNRKAVFIASEMCVRKYLFNRCYYQVFDHLRYIVILEKPQREFKLSF